MRLGRRVADTVGLARALQSNLARIGGGDGGGGSPFEFRVLECLLAATVAFFECGILSPFPGRHDLLRLLLMMHLLTLPTPPGKRQQGSGQ